MEDVRWITHALAGSSSLISVLCDASTLAAVSLLAFMFSLATGVFITFMVLVLSFIPLALAAGVCIAFLVLVSALSASNPQAIQASLLESKQRSHEQVFLQKPNLVYIWLDLITVGWVLLVCSESRGFPMIVLSVTFIALGTLNPLRRRSGRDWPSPPEAGSFVRSAKRLPVWSICIILGPSSP